MPRLVRLLLWFSLALLIPAIPFAVLGDSFEQSQLDWLQNRHDPAMLAWGVGGLLAIDLFLPVPSTAVCTYAGGTLSFWVALVSSFGGILVGNLVGFSLARTLGRPFAVRFANDTDIRWLDTLSQKWGLLVLIVTRAIPLLAEAAVLLMGVSRLSWGKFLIGVLPANLIITFVYVSIGAWFRESPALTIAIFASAVLPLILVLVLRRLGPREELTETVSDV